MEAIKKVLDSGSLVPDITVMREGFEKSPLSLACIYGQASVVEELLKVWEYCKLAPLLEFAGGYGEVRGRELFLIKNI